MLLFINNYTFLVLNLFFQLIDYVNVIHTIYQY